MTAKDYILKKFLAENPDPDKTCYSHFTTATGKPVIVTFRNDSTWHVSTFQIPKTSNLCSAP